jgi:CheY-specific phosphatase CheX
MTQVKSQGIAVNPVLLDRVIRGTVEGLMMTGSTPVPVGASRFQVGGGDLTVLIGLIGDYTGTMTINCTTKMALFMAAALLGEEQEDLNADVLDAVGEIGNMISGSFKDLMLDTKMAFSSISCPRRHHRPQLRPLLLSRLHDPLGRIRGRRRLDGESQRADPPRRRLPDEAIAPANGYGLGARYVRSLG